MEWLIALIGIAAAGAGLRRLMAHRQSTLPDLPEPPDDPYSNVPAGLKKGPPHRSDAVALEEPEEDDR